MINGKFIISVIIPVYNVERYLEQCIDSIMNQTYKNLEIILIDDGSKDKSGFICDKYKMKDSRITVLHKENSGLGYARNSGLDIATGKYVVFVDSDDYCDMDLIERLLDPILTTGADTVIGGFQRVDDEGKVLYREKYPYTIYEEDQVKSKLFYRMLGSSPQRSDAIRMSVWNAIYDMDIINNNHIRFPSEKDYISEDIVFDEAYFRYSKKAVLIDSMAYKYRFNYQSLTLIYNSKRLEKSKFLYSKLTERLIEDGYGKEAIIRLQRMFFVNIRKSIIQEKTKFSGLPLKKCLENIKIICDDQLLRDIITEYPIKYLGYKQKIFLMLIKKHFSLGLYLLVNEN